MKNSRGYVLTALLCLGMMVSVSAQGGRLTPIELLRDMFRRPASEWRGQLKQHNYLLTNDFFTNVEKRIRWGLENNHIDDALRFAMVGDFGAEVKRRPANFRIDMADVFFKAENDLMTGQIVDNIIISSPGTPSAKKARFLRGRLLERKKDLFQAHEEFVKLAEERHRPADTWWRAGMISWIIQQESRAVQEIQKAAGLGNPDAKVWMERYKARRKGGWEQIAPLPDTSPGATGKPKPGTSTTTSTGASGKSDYKARLAVASGNFIEGVVTYQALLKDDPNNLGHLQSLAALYYRMGDLKEAKKLLDKALVPYPKDVKLLRFRGNTYERMFDRSGKGADLTNALADYRKASALAPNDPILRLELRRASDKN